MYNIDTLVDNAAKQTKSVFTYIPNEEIRTGFETLVDAQAAYTKAMVAVTTDIAKTVAESATSFVPKQTVAKK
jgi:hypothetical protein